MSVRTFLLAVVVIAMTSVSGDAVERPFGSGTGTLDWSVGANWANGQTPDQQGGGGDQGLLGDATADRTVTVSDTTGGANGPDARLNWKQTTAGVVNKIQLLSDWEPSSCCTSEGYFTNDTGDSNAMVMDLNGNEWRTFGGGTLSLPAMTIQGPGVWEQDRKLNFGDGTKIGAGVTIKNNFGGANWSGTAPAWDPTSTLQVSTPAGTIFSGTAPIAVGNLHILSTGNASFASNGNAVVQGDVTIDPGGTLTVGATTKQFAVLGNFTDTNTTGNYSSGRLHFSGGGSVQQIDIRRPIDSAIRLDAGTVRADLQPATAGIQLLHDLDASASTNVNPHESIFKGAAPVDLNGHDASFNRLVMVNPDITWAADRSNQSVINIGADGVHFIGSIAVTVTNGQGGFAGGDLVLFNVDSSAVWQGSPSAGSITLPDGWTSSGTIARVGDQVVLQGVQVPEPSTLVMLMLGGLLALRVRSSSKR